MTEKARSNSEAPFTWKGRQLVNNGQIRDEMVRLIDPQQAHIFITSLRDKYGIDADVIVLRISALSNTRQEMVALLGRFLGRDCSGEFFITEAPQDEYANTAYKPCVREVRISESMRLEVLAPTEMIGGHPTLNPLGYKYFVVAGPARMLSRDEWKQLVGFQDPE